MFSRGGSLSRICRGTGAGRPDHKNLILPYDIKKEKQKNKKYTLIPMPLWYTGRLRFACRRNFTRLVMDYLKTFECHCED